jgi:hypothetical protein
MALPQAFAETTAGDWTIKAGHFLANGPSGQYSTDRFFATRTIAEHLHSPRLIFANTLTSGLLKTLNSSSARLLRRVLVRLGR